LLGLGPFLVTFWVKTGKSLQNEESCFPKVGFRGSGPLILRIETYNYGYRELPVAVKNRAKMTKTRVRGSKRSKSDPKGQKVTISRVSRVPKLGGFGGTLFDLEGRNVGRWLVG